MAFNISKTNDVNLLENSDFNLLFAPSNRQLKQLDVSVTNSELWFQETDRSGDV